MVRRYIAFVPPGHVNEDAVKRMGDVAADYARTHGKSEAEQQTNGSALT